MDRIFADYHMHTTFSPDGHNTPREMCLAALEKGLTEIAVTDHFEFFHKAVNADARYSKEIIGAGQKALDACRKEFSGRLTIRNGVEIGQPQVDPSRAAELLSALPFDYVIGSIHKLDDVDMGQMDYPDEVISGRVHQNLSMMVELADRYDFD